MNVKVMKDWMNRPYAFVQYENVDDARAALDESHDTIIDGRHIRVEQARVNRTLFLAKLPKTLSDDALQKYLERWGRVEDVTLLTNQTTGKSKGCGFAKFRYREDAIRAYLHIRQQAKWAVEWAANIEKHQPETDRHAIFVGQLNPDQVSEQALGERFGRHGPIESVNLVNKNGEAFAFIRYEDEESAQEAIDAENGQEFQDRRLRVQFRETPDPRTTKKPVPVPAFLPAPTHPLTAPLPVAGKGSRDSNSSRDGGQDRSSRTSGTGADLSGMHPAAAAGAYMKHARGLSMPMPLGMLDMHHHHHPHAAYPYMPNPYDPYGTAAMMGPPAPGFMMRPAFGPMSAPGSPLNKPGAFMYGPMAGMPIPTASSGPTGAAGGGTGGAGTSTGPTSAAGSSASSPNVMRGGAGTGTTGSATGAAGGMVGAGDPSSMAPMMMYYPSGPAAYNPYYMPPPASMYMKGPAGAYEHAMPPYDPYAAAAHAAAHMQMAPAAGGGGVGAGSRSSMSSKTGGTGTGAGAGGMGMRGYNPYLAAGPMLAPQHMYGGGGLGVGADMDYEDDL
ncbi:hypothetical protein AMAG_14586 [Allomyces macrogynus ATCC 38327]|uniref:RRM domain-containing protein n=1 Tax=Allomyces macrogynus (strain ATCC 38327) TaxID=578462 RepID=A0A0L0T7E6_ALLM3|nr:hypothetical protein AMAG_14586 [Allomyces macrogynus ATCC 38327]|eukprot:KNE70459.1 hypothetical protein AMAG_14586 [Allomyces macrogynus ATCC 38327]